MKVKLKQFAGPFKSPPFEYFIQSPIGLVDKDHGKSTRLIFHLSYPRDGESSVNVNTPQEDCHVKYIDFDQAIQLCLKELEQSQSKILYLGKSDYKSAFRVIGLNKQSWPCLVLKAESPLTGEVLYFVDKCLPFGHSISCAIFQEISHAMAHLVQVRISKRIINYLDDYLFVAMVRARGNEQIRIFLNVCKKVGMPVSMEKTFWCEEVMTFLGFLIDGKNQLVMVPLDKVAKANQMVQEITNVKKRKVTVL